MAKARQSSIALYRVASFSIWCGTGGGCFCATLVQYWVNQRRIRVRLICNRRTKSERETKSLKSDRANENEKEMKGVEWLFRFGWVTLPSFLPVVKRFAMAPPFCYLLFVSLFLSLWVPTPTDLPDLLYLVSLPKRPNSHDNNDKSLGNGKSHAKPKAIDAKHPVLSSLHKSITFFFFFLLVNVLNSSFSVALAKYGHFARWPWPLF